MKEKGLKTTVFLRSLRVERLRVSVKRLLKRFIRTESRLLFGMSSVTLVVVKSTERRRTVFGRVIEPVSSFITLSEFT